MPIFEYQCQKCGYIFEEVLYKYITDKVSTQCPICKSIAPKIMSKGSFRIKGYSEKNGYSKEE
jgi:putative FmdB family regulatory protein